MQEEHGAIVEVTGICSKGHSVHGDVDDASLKSECEVGDLVLEEINEKLENWVD